MSKQLNLYTDQRNFDTLKCLLVSLTNGVQFQIHVANPNLFPSGALGLPALEVEPNKFLSDIAAILMFVIRTFDIKLFNSFSLSLSLLIFFFK